MTPLPREETATSSEQCCNDWTPVGNYPNRLICNWFTALITGLVTPVSWLILCRSAKAGRPICTGIVRVGQPLFNYAIHISGKAGLNPRIIISPHSLTVSRRWILRLRTSPASMESMAGNPGIFGASYFSTTSKIFLLFFYCWGFSDRRFKQILKMNE